MDSYENRLARIKAAKMGDTITVPEDWTPGHNDSAELSMISGGDVILHDGSNGSLPWYTAIGGKLIYFFSNELADAGFDVDSTDLGSLSEEDDRRVMALSAAQTVLGNRVDAETVVRYAKFIIEGE